MNLREARFKDHWRRAFLRKYPTRFSRLSFKRLSCLADSTFQFTDGINAVIGSNGVGKSTLVSAMAELLSDGAEVAPGHRERLRGSILEGDVLRDNVDVHLMVEDDEKGGRKSSAQKFDGSYRWLDPSDFGNRCLNQIHRDQNFGDLL